MTTFNPLTQQHLGHYVYALIDPSDGKIFYVGKGQGNRAFDHARAALSTATPSDKLDTIRRIIKAGRQVEILILRHGLSDQGALVAESVLIDFLTHPLTKDYRRNAKLTNIQAGHDMREFGIRKAEEVEAQYGSTPLGTVTEKLIAININGTYKNPSSSIYEATREAWVLSKRRADQADYILSEYRGVVRAVFQMNAQGWQPCPTVPNERQRYFFDGHEVTDPAILARYINRQIPKKRGMSNPIRYINM